MGTISSGVGLISGLDIEGIVEKLMAIERRPVELLQNQISTLQAEKAAYMAISAQLLGLKTKISTFKAPVTFRPNVANSSNDSVLSASANSEASPGTYTFKVLQTAQTHQLISQGFNDIDRTPIGTGSLTIELGEGRLDRAMPLSMLNDQQGVRRGKIRITDRSGNSAIVDLSTAITISDVLDAINSASGVNVTAKVSADRIIVEDNSSGDGSLIIEDLYGGYAAKDLGIAKSSSSGSIVGDDVLNLTELTPLRFLNDGNGVRTSGTTSDIRITLRDGSSFNVGLSGLLTADLSLSVLNHGQGVRAGSIRITDKSGNVAMIDLSSASTVGDVVNAINEADIGVNAAIVGSRLLITDVSGGSGSLKIENADGGSTATDLGIEAETTGKSISGKEIYSIDTVGDVIRAIEEAAVRNVGEGKLSVEIADDGNGLFLVDSTIGSGNFRIESINGSFAAEDLGIVADTPSSTITGRRILAGLNTVLLRSLNGGAGVALGTIRIQDRSGNVADIDLSSAQTLEDVLFIINNTDGVNVRASLNSTGTGILIEDLTGSSTHNLVVSDVDSTTASDLKIAADVSSSVIDSGNNQLQYVSQNTLLSELNGGKGVSAGSFTIVDSSGKQATISIGENELDTMTVGELIDRINNSNIGVIASINDTGDGILLTDNAGGAGRLTVREVGTSLTAHSLNLAGEASSAGSGGRIDGAFEYKITVGGADTLQDLVNKINDLGGPFSASIINDGSGVNAYRLSIVSSQSGREGMLIVNTDIPSLKFFDLVEPKDAIISFGTGTSSITTSSSSNTFSNIITGLTITAHSASEEPVTISVSRDIDGVVEDIKGFVDSLNDIFDKLSEYTKYDSETEEAGVLLGDYTVDIIANRLRSAMRANYIDSGNIRSLRDIGITTGTDGKFEFDEERFRAVYQNDPEAIEKLFATEDTGFGYVLDELIDNLTDADGMITRKTENYDDIIDIHQERIEYLEELLEAKEQRLYNDFYRMEQALAQMQSIMNTLSSFITSTSINYGSNS